LGRGTRHALWANGPYSTQRPHPLVEGGRPRCRDGTLLCPAQLPGAPHTLAANGLIGINSPCTCTPPSTFYKLLDIERPSFYGHGEGTLALETLGWCGRLQGFRRREEEKTFTLGGGPQSMIQTDEGLAARLPLDPHERCGQLQPIRCTQGVPLEGRRGVVPDGLAGEDIRPGSREARKKCPCVLFIPRLEETFPPQAREGGPALHHAAPPDNHERILRQHLAEPWGPGLFETVWQDGRGIPALHRPVSRSSVSARRPSPWGSLGRGSVHTSSGTCPEPHVTRPAWARAASDAGSAASGFANGTIFAIGVPRSVTTTSAPAFTHAKHARRVACNWDTDA
jgi:hypothetical protein